MQFDNVCLGRPRLEAPQSLPRRTGFKRYAISGTSDSIEMDPRAMPYNAGVLRDIAKRDGQVTVASASRCCGTPAPCTQIIINEAVKLGTLYPTGKSGRYVAA